MAPAVKNMERLAAEFSSDPEQVLPEAGALELAKSYREKRVKPLWEKIVKVLRSVYRAYLDLSDRFNRLQSMYNRELEGRQRLTDRLQEAQEENKALRGIAANYERVKRVFGLEEVEQAVRRPSAGRLRRRSRGRQSGSLAGGEVIISRGHSKGCLLIYACQRVLLLL